MDNWITPRPPEFNIKRPLFLCVLANTDTAKIPGISAAGKSHDVIEYTPAGDAELVTLGRTICKNDPPMTNNSPTPAVITRAAMQLTKIPFMFINSGLRILPQIPLLDVGGKAGRDIRTARAVPDASLIYKNSVELGRQIQQLSELVIIGESVPGGTTTAMCVLKALGIDGRVSSSYPENPLDIKKKTVEEAFRNAGISFGELADDPLRAIEYFGDPMIPCVCGLLEGLDNTSIVLAGGTQMIAVLALMKRLGIERNVSVATTKFVAEDSSANFLESISNLGFKSYIADPGFNRSRNSGLRMYESGVVKDGVGAGGAMLAASLFGVSQQKFREQVELVCDQLFK
jgi:uncharacterized protein (TIGR00303 family)